MNHVVTCKEPEVKCPEADGRRGNPVVTCMEREGNHQFAVVRRSIAEVRRVITEGRRLELKGKCQISLVTHVKRVGTRRVTEVTRVSAEVTHVRQKFYA